MEDRGPKAVQARAIESRTGINIHIHEDKFNVQLGRMVSEEAISLKEISSWERPSPHCPVEKDTVRRLGALRPFKGQGCQPTKVHSIESRDCPALSHK